MLRTRILVAVMGGALMALLVIGPAFAAYQWTD
jgi:hypothetical protein